MAFRLIELKVLRDFPSLVENSNLQYSQELESTQNLKSQMWDTAKTSCQAVSCKSMHKTPKKKKRASKARSDGGACCSLLM